MKLVYFLSKKAAQFFKKLNNQTTFPKVVCKKWPRILSFKKFYRKNLVKEIFTPSAVNKKVFWPRKFNLRD